jgi:methionyl-tRNA formyltransferase
MADRPAVTVLFFGMTGAFSLPPLEALLKAGIEVRGVVVPESPHSSRGLPILNPYVRRNIVEVAHEHRLPVFGDFEALPEADVITVVCFDRLIPRPVRDAARLAVNVHPSLLPANRGPAPLFWTFRLGEHMTGVTVHLLDDRADTGAILEQAEVPVPEGVDGAGFERRLAELGGQLLVKVIARFAEGALCPRPQDEAQASYHGWPCMDDWLIPSDWPEQRAENFRRGVAHLGGPLRRVAG